MNYFRYLLLIADLIIVAVSMSLSLGVHPFSYDSPNELVYENIILVAVVAWGIALWSQKSCYSFRARTLKNVLWPMAISSLKAGAGLLAYIYYAHPPISLRSQLLVFFLICLAGLVLQRTLIYGLLDYFRRRGRNLQRVLIVGDGKRARSVAEIIMANPQWGVKIMGFIAAGDSLPLESKTLRRINDIPVIGSLDILSRFVKARRVDWIIFASDFNEREQMQNAIRECHLMGIKTMVLADIPAPVNIRRQIVEFGNQIVIVSNPEPEITFSLLLKSVLDRILAFWGLVILSPILSIVALLVKITSPGPVFFKQKRLGLNGRAFVMYKFRTMVRNADNLKKALLPKNEMDGPVFKMKNDPRVTPLGKFLRKTSLDELPQLFNVLRGDMSLVGPRPPLPAEVKRYDLWQRRKLSVKPGITCLWQINGRNEIPFRDWMKMDLEYIDNWSLWLDLKILARTIPTVLSGRGAR